MKRGPIVLSVNASWNIVNFRSELIRALQQHGFEVVALAPEDDHSARLGEMGVPFHPIRIDSQSVSPLNDARLIKAYHAALREIRPALFLGYRPFGPRLNVIAVLADPRGRLILQFDELMMFKLVGPVYSVGQEVADRNESPVGATQGYVPRAPDMRLH